VSRHRHALGVLGSQFRLIGDGERTRRSANNQSARQSLILGSRDEHTANDWMPAAVSRGSPSVRSRQAPPRAPVHEPGALWSGCLASVSWGDRPGVLVIRYDRLGVGRETVHWAAITMT